VATGLISLLDDVAGIAKVAAASLDDVAGQAARAGVKAAGVVIDDTAVTPTYMVGFAAERELPIVAKIAMGSLRNKLLILLPAVLALDAFAPGAVTPLLALGGAFLCYEGAEKVLELVHPHEGGGHAEPYAGASEEDARVAGAIRTDFILSSEIMAIALASIPEGTTWSKAVALSLVALAITGGVYGAVAAIVKMDDVGLALSRNRAASAWGRTSRLVGRGLVRGMPALLATLSAVGTAAMLWVGGGIVLHGLDHVGYPGPAGIVHDASHAAATAVPFAPGMAEWLAGALASGAFGLLLGAAIVPMVSRVLAPAWAAGRRALARP